MYVYTNGLSIILKKNKKVSLFIFTATNEPITWYKVAHMAYLRFENADIIPVWGVNSNNWNITGTGTGDCNQGNRWGARGGRGSGFPEIVGMARPEEIIEA